VADKALIDALVEFADALQAERIDPRLVDVLLPSRDWSMCCSRPASGTTWPTC
jgi:hypothetical protein